MSVIFISYSHLLKLPIIIFLKLKMKLLVIFLLTFVLFGFVSEVLSRPGGVYKVDPKDYPSWLETLKSFENEFPAKLNTIGSGLYYRLGKVISGNGQVVSGVLTWINFELFERPCDRISDCTERLNICTATFFSFTGDEEFQNLACTKK